MRPITTRLTRVRARDDDFLAASPIDFASAWQTFPLLSVVGGG